MGGLGWGAENTGGGPLVEEWPAKVCWGRRAGMGGGRWLDGWVVKEGMGCATIGGGPVTSGVWGVWGAEGRAEKDADVCGCWARVGIVRGGALGCSGVGGACCCGNWSGFRVSVDDVTGVSLASSGNTIRNGIL